MKLKHTITNKKNLKVLSKADQKKVKGGNTNQSDFIIIHDVTEG